VKEFNDGKTSAAVGQEWATSIRVPVIPDADNYKGPMYTVTIPDEKMEGGGFTVAFAKREGKVIEAWMKKYAHAERGDKLIFSLEDGGCVRIGVRRGGH